MRVILIKNNIVIGVKYPLDDYVLQEGELFSETGEDGQIQQPDGTFITPVPEPVEPMPTLEEMQTQTLLNTEYLVVISEITNS